MPSRTYSDALKLLREEREALRAGQLQTVAALAGQKEALVEDVAQMRLSVQDAQKLQKQAAGNAQLLDAALTGLREAQKRLAALRAVRGGLDIYTATGGRETVAKSGGTLEHKV